MGIYDPLPPGAPVTKMSITVYNELLAMLKQFKRGTLSGPNNFHPLQRNPGLVYVKNESGYDVARLGILGLSDDVLFDHADNADEFIGRPTLTGTTPTTASHSGTFVIAQVPIVAGRPGLALLAGVTAVQLNVGDADHEYADVRNNDRTELDTGDGGAAQILYKESGTGSGKWALVLLGPGARVATHILAQVDGAVAESDPTITIDNVKILLPAGATLYPKTGSTAPTSAKNTHDGALDDDAWIQAVWNKTDSQFETYAGDCPA